MEQLATEKSESEIKVYNHVPHSNFMTRRCLLPYLLEGLEFYSSDMYRMLVKFSHNFLFYSL